jgi:hypothetical protein
MKWTKWLLLTLGLLVLLSVFNLLIKLVAALVGVIGWLISAVAMVVFHKSFWILLAVGFVAYLLMKRSEKGRFSQEGGSASGAQGLDPYGAHPKVMELDRRLDRLNDILGHYGPHQRRES